MYIAQAPPIPLPTNLLPSSVTVLEWDHIRKNNQWICFHFYAPNTIHLLVFRQPCLGMWNQKTNFFKSLGFQIQSAQFRY